MSKHAHTPGPWLLIDDSVMADPRSHIPDTMLGIATLMDHDGERPAYIQKANASLICAAPRLLEALEDARIFILNGIELGYIVMPDADTPDPAHNTLPKIEAAIAKARGES